LRVAVLLSGTGRTLDNFLRRIESKQLPATIVAVASNKPQVKGLAIAAAAGIPQEVFARADHTTRAARDAVMLGWIRAHRPDVIALAGYLALLDLTEARGIPVLNIHPALLPRFGGKGYYGDRVHAAVLAAGETETGATVHLVDAAYDRGPIVAQARVPVQPGDDVHRLASRVFEAECELYPRVLTEVAEGILDLRALASREGP
jgi:formyltetrahydrofolate-dependent phosphoribosylglycinamide formyltransferase